MHRVQHVGVNQQTCSSVTRLFLSLHLHAFIWGCPWWSIAKVLTLEGWEEVKWKLRSWFCQDHLGFYSLADSLLSEMITDCIWRGEGKSDLDHVCYLSANNAAYSCEEWNECIWHYICSSCIWLFNKSYYLCLLFTCMCLRKISVIVACLLAGRGTCGGLWTVSALE